MYSFSISIGGVLAAAVINFIIGAFWYSPLAFLPAWMKITGITDAQGQQKGPALKAINFALIFLGLLLIAFVVAFFLKNLFIPSLSQAMAVGFWLWFGGVAATKMIDTVTMSSSESAPSAQRTRSPGDAWKLFAITSGYYLVVFLVSSLILFVF
jgi:hypothetical protein